MECLIGLGTGICTRIGEYTVQPVGRQVGYQFYYKSNLESLMCQLSKLDVVSEDVERRVDEEKRNLREAVGEVKDWLTEVKQITDEANNILKEAENEAKMKCLHGFCPNLVLRHRLSRKSTKLVPAIDALREKEFTSFAFDITPQEIRYNNYEAFNSRTEMVSRIMDVLRKSPETNMIGVYGIGGVGKTTLVKEVAMQAADEKTLFDDVAMVLDVKKNPDIKRIQSEIAEKLGLKFRDDETSILARARRLFSRIKDKKTLVILDDVWERIDLVAMGLVGVPNCKVLLTSRTRDVLSRDMHTQKEFQLKVLNEYETWTLFRKTVGDVVEDPSIRNVATQVAERCRGLPVLVVTVASALRNNSKYHAWNDALRRLGKVEEGEELTEKAYSALEWTYDQLNAAELRQLFLLCGFLAGHSNSVFIRDLLKYIIGNMDTMAAAWDALNSLLDKLKDACLLLDSNDEQCVRMHDLVHDVATRILSRDQHVLKADLEEWPNISENCTMISLRTSDSDIPKLPEVLDCKGLIVLQIGRPGYNNHSLISIPGSFFNQLKKLKVMDFSCLSIPSLPPSLEFLKDLQILCLDWCRLEDIALVGKLEKLEILSFGGSKFKELPSEIGELTHLRLLDLSNCSELEVISPNVISSLKRLEELRMRNSFTQWEADGINITERKNASLSELKHLSRLSALQIHILDASILPTCLFSSNELERYEIYVGSSWKWDGEDENFNSLKLNITAGHELEQAGVNMLLKRTKELHIDGTEAGRNTSYKFRGEDFEQLKHLHLRNAEFRHINNVKVVFEKLTSLMVHQCDDLRFLFSSSMAKCLVRLKHLEITECQTMEEIVLTEESGEENTEDMFLQLQHLKLKGLPKLAKFCSGSNYIEFPTLQRLHLKMCANLKSFILRPSTKNIAIVNEMVDGHFKEYSLFDQRVGFPRLERFSINGFTELTSIWDDQLAPNSFFALRAVKVQQCDRLRSIFVTNIMGRLKNLEKMSIEKCGSLKDIVAMGKGIATVPRFLFPHMTSVTFINLPQLKSFYPGVHVFDWPLLQMLVMDGCAKVEIFATVSDELGSPSTPVFAQSFFRTGVDGFPNLTSLVLHRCDNLRFLLSYSMARSLVHLKHLEISECQVLREIILANSCDEENLSDILIELEHLELNGLPNLARVGYEDVTKFFALTTLKVVECAELKKFIFDPLNKTIAIYKENEGPHSKENLQTIVEHFIVEAQKVVLPQLTSLIVHRRDGLRFLLSSSMAKRILQVKHRETSELEIIEEIVSTTEYGEESLGDLSSKLEMLDQYDIPNPTKFDGYLDFSSIKRLSEVECTKLETVIDPVSKNISFYKETQERNSKQDLENVVHHIYFDEKMLYRSLTRLIINGRHGLSFFISTDMARNLGQLIHLVISECKIMKEIVCGKENMNGMFRKLKHLEFNDLPKLTRFCSASYIEFPSLERLQLEKCTELETFITNTDTVTVSHFLFDEKVGFPKLEILTINDLPKLTTIWHKQLARDSFYRLRDVTILKCDNVKNIVADSIVSPVFQQLQKLTVEECGVDEIVSQDQRREALTADQLVFQNLTCLELKSLLQLNRFYPTRGAFKFPKLKTLVLLDSLKVLDIFASEFPSLQGSHMSPTAKQSSILTDKSSFPNLGDLTLGPMDILYRQPPSAAVLYEQAPPPRISTDGPFPHLRIFRLHGVQKVTFPGEENSQLVGPFFPQLDILEVVLPNLSSLMVHECDGLRFLFSSSMAKRLVELKYLKISKCQIIEEIIMTQEYGEENADGYFPKLQELELYDLPNFARFLSRSDTKFPSLETLKMEECNKLKKVIFDPLNKNIATYREIERRDSNETLETVVQQYIVYVEKVALPKLKSLVVDKCDGFSLLLSSVMARSIVTSKDRGVSECQIMEKVHRNEDIEQSRGDVFAELEQLVLQNLPNLDRFCLESYIEFQSTVRSKVVECTKLETIFAPSSKSIVIYHKLKEQDSNGSLDTFVDSFPYDKKVPLSNLSSLIVHRCHGLNILLSSDMAKSLVQLKHLKISECHQITEVMRADCREENINMFSKLKHLELNDLPNLTCFCSGSYIEFPSLEILALQKCTELETFICKENEGTDTSEPYFLFDEKVVFPKLEKLTITDLPKVATIWCSQLASNSFCILRDLTVKKCNRLNYILPDSIVARVFQQIQKLTVEECRVEEIVAQKERGEALEAGQFFFPRLICLELKSLLKLKRFYPRLNVLKWSLLETLVMVDCPIIDIFAAEFSSCKKLPFVFIEKKSFSNLKDLTLGPMCTDIWYGSPPSAVSCQQAIFPKTISDIPNLKKLRLHGMERLTCLWEENSDPVGAVFPELDILEVKFCSLNNLLELSPKSKSFKYLTSLEVTFCWRLQYLATCSVARSFEQLKRLKVDECKGMKEILASDGTGKDEIVFTKLEHLEFSDLVSLERFWSNNLIVRVPALKSDALKVTWCPFKLKISNGELEEDIVQHHSRKEEAVVSTEKQPGTSEGKQGVKGLNPVSQETLVNSEIIEITEVVDRHADLGKQKRPVEPLNTNEGKQLELEDNSLSQNSSNLDLEIRTLQEELRAIEAKRRDTEQKLAERLAKRFATIDPSES